MSIYPWAHADSDRLDRQTSDALKWDQLSLDEGRFAEHRFWCDTRGCHNEATVFGKRRRFCDDCDPYNQWLSQ